ncbi:MAG: protein kinase [Cyanobacteria bacterium P01_A01_bin.80]
MSAKVTLTITEGKLSGKHHTFDSRTSCIIGRASDCNIKLPNDKNHSTISRYHCLLDINPPDIRIRDFGSKNGTYVNSKKIGQRESHQTPEEGAKIQFPEYDLQSNDKIELGNTVFEVNIETDPEAIKIPHFVAPTVNNATTPNLLEHIEKIFNLAQEGNNNLGTIKNYDIVKLLGKGGFGEVYLAQHNQSQEYVALKVMLPQVAANEWAVQMFTREMANTKALQHRNVVKLLDYSFSEGLFFFTMEFCTAGTVEDLLENRGGKLPVDIAVPIILQVLDGLEYTHNAEIPYVKLNDGNFGKGKGLVHRDLKPGNIFLTEIDDEMIVRIGDYGLSKAFDLAGLSGQSITGTRAGTPVFIPRQQVLEFKYAKPEVDIWAAAASLYYMLTKCYPRDFTGNDIFLAVLRNKPIPIRDRDTNIPIKLAEVIDLALIEEPEIYFKSAKAFKQGLLSVL